LEYNILVENHRKIGSEATSEKSKDTAVPVTEEPKNIESFCNSRNKKDKNRFPT
jgi:hypothetical protein